MGYRNERKAAMQAIVQAQNYAAGDFDASHQKTNTTVGNEDTVIFWKSSKPQNSKKHQVSGYTRRRRALAMQKKLQLLEAAKTLSEVSTCTGASACAPVLSMETTERPCRRSKKRWADVEDDSDAELETLCRRCLRIQARLGTASQQSPGVEWTLGTFLRSHAPLVPCSLAAPTEVATRSLSAFALACGRPLICASAAACISLYSRLSRSRSYSSWLPCLRCTRGGALVCGKALNNRAATSCCVSLVGNSLPHCTVHH